MYITSLRAFGRTDVHRVINIVYVFSKASYKT